MFEGVLLGFLSWLSLVFSWSHLPKWMKKFSIKHFVITDIITTTLTWLLISGVSKSLVAVVSCVTAGLMMNFTMAALGRGLLPQVFKQEKK